MAFPTSPVNNQTATINGTVYYYDSTRSAWRVSAAINNPTTSAGTFSNVTVSSALVIPAGNTNVRANTGVTSGTMRLNTDSGNLEVFFTNANGSAWFSAVNLNSVPSGPKANSTGSVTIIGSYTLHTFNTSGSITAASNLSAEIMMVAGGGGGGGVIGGGGGAGGIMIGNITLPSGTSNILIGAGGTGGIGYYNGAAEQGTNGSNSNVAISGTTYEAIGGGGGGSVGTIGGQGLSPPRNGGSGGGASGYNASTSYYNPAVPYGSATQGNQSPFTGYGNNGGTAISDLNTSSGGGGAGSTGGVNTSSVCGNGGSGKEWPTGSGNYYAGGGGGGARSGSATKGNGGSGGGGNGGTDVASNGSNNTGGGGGGGGYTGSSNNQNGGNGGSGIVIIRYLT